MEEFTGLTVERFLDQTADRTPTPGGGGVTALAGALACAMGRMVAAYSVGKKTDAAVAARVQEAALRLERADQLLRALITEDAKAYTAMTEAAKAAKADPSKEGGRQAAILAAIAVPMEMAALSSSALETMDEFKSIASKYLLSDLGVAAVLADATARASRYSVRINLGDVADATAAGRIAAEIDTIIAHCDQRRGSIEAFVGERLAGAK